MVSYTVFVLLALCAFAARAQNQNGIYDSRDQCGAACVGDHDVGCSQILGGGPQHACRCQPTFYSRGDLCEEECENQQYWSLFTYGACREYDSKVLPSACKMQCVFRVRVWATVFMIILFVSACIVILALLPTCVITCLACLRVRKHGRDLEDMQIAGEISGKPHPGQQQHQHQGGAATVPWHYPYYNYYGAQGQGRM